jgi:hypothetical protein
MGVIAQDCHFRRAGIPGFIPSEIVAIWRNSIMADTASKIPSPVAAVDFFEPGMNRVIYQFLKRVEFFGAFEKGNRIAENRGIGKTSRVNQKGALGGGYQELKFISMRMPVSSFGRTSRIIK